MLPLLLSSLLAVSADSLPPDGPYLFYESDSLVAHWADTEERTTGKVVFSPDNFAALPEFASFDPGYVDPDRSFIPETTAHYSGVSKVAAISDIHGQFETGRELLRANGIIDSASNWAYGDGHLVIVGDIFDRGDQVTELLWLVYKLEQQADRAGGRVHFLLGNHETMILEGDERYLNARYRTTSGLIGEFYKDLYGPNTYLGRWLRSLPLAVEINDIVFIHGGLSRSVVREVRSIDQINQLYRDYLIDAEDLSSVTDKSARLELLYGRTGPLWYRGYFSREGFSEQDLKFVLRKIDAKGIVVGHTSFTAVSSYFDNRVIAVDSSIKFGSVGEILIIEDGSYFRGTISGKRIPLKGSTK
ncbi:metallophosphoesterase [Neolewinella litorea]|uniref:metallophosphoesterase n=1 Tax=Neolewinella litorea TaxID=2562452 RepID=UPI001455F9B9|nr:metallophosphoesterase [Neolewinella litorea]